MADRKTFPYFLYVSKIKMSWGEKKTDFRFFFESCIFDSYFTLKTSDDVVLVIISTSNRVK